MTDANTTRRVSDDEYTIVLIGLSGLLAAFLLTPVGFCGIAIPLVLYKISGRPNWALACVLISLCVLVVAYVAGATADVWAAYGGLAKTILEPRFDASAFILRWFRLGLSPQVWLFLLPLGGIIGSAVALISYGGRSSQLAALMQGKVVDPVSRAPLAGWFQRRLNKKPARKGNHIVLGGDWVTGQAIVISENDLNRHMLVAGTTGAGKTVGILNLIEGSPGIGTIIIDGKGDLELARSVYALAKARNQEFYLFDGTLAARKSAVYNPFASGDHTSLADRVVTLREWTEPHYLSLARGFAQTAFQVLQACGHRVDLITVEKSLSTKTLLALIRRARKPGDDYQELARRIAAQRNADEQIEGLRADLRNLANSVLAPLFDTAKARRDKNKIISLRRARQENAVVYFCLPTPKYPEFAALLGKLIINDIKATMTSAKTPWRIVLDEFSVFAGPQVLNLINMGRSYGISAILATQSYADIAQGAEKNGDKFLDQVLGSVNTFLTYRMNASNDCELAASLAGTLENVEYTAQTEGGSGTGAASARHARSFRIHPDVIRTLNVGQAIYVNKNQSPTTYGNYSMIIARNPKDLSSNLRQKSHPKTA